MKVSVITPCFNAAPYIQRTIASVQAQTISDWEMIIVDDGSTDNSVSIIRIIAAQDARIRLIEKENGGSASARNLGLQYAHGEYIQFLDADDTLAPDKFEKQINLMESNHLDVSYTDYREFNPDGTIEELKGLNESLLHVLVAWGVLGTIPQHVYLYKRDFIQTHNICFAPIREREDWDWHIKVYSLHPKVQRLKGYCGAYYFRCPTGKTSGGDIQKLGKLQQGYCNFLCYRISTLHGYKRFLLLLRFSVALWTIFLQMVRYKMWDMARIYKVFTQKWYYYIYFIYALLLMPFSFILYMIGFVYCHYIEYKKHEVQKIRSVKSSIL